MDPGKIRNKKYPITYVGHCDFDLRTQNYPCPVTYYQGPCPPVRQGEIGGCTQHGNYPGVMEDYHQPGFSGWWTAALAALGALSAYALNAWARLKAAKTDAEKQAIMNDIYKRHKEGDLSDEEYKLLLAQYGGFLDEETQEQLMWANWWKKNKYYVLGGGLGLLALMMMRKR